jgi:TRAP-type C4-dicarboxylate transport system substrate-binding protein
MHFKTILAVTAAILAGTASAGADDITMRVAALGTADNPINRCGPVRIAEEIAERSGGRIKPELFLGGSAFANPTKLYEQVERGITDYTWAVLSYSPGRFKLTEVIGLPLLVDDQVEAARVLNNNIDAYLSDEFKGVHVLALAVISPNQWHLREPITSLDDLNGLRMRTSSGAIADALTALGAAPVSMPVTQQYENLQRGVIDGSNAPWATVAAFRLNEVTKAHVEVNFGASVGVLALSKKFYDGLPEDLRTIIDEEFTGPELGARISACWNGVGDKGMALAEESGGEITHLSEADTAALVATVEPVIANALEELEAEGLPAKDFYATLQEQLSAARQAD